MSSRIDHLEPLAEFFPWLAANDPHAQRHIHLAEQADRIIWGEEPAPAAVRRQLACQLERWRYQLLNEMEGAITQAAWRLADALDLASNRLAGRPDRAPRRPAAAAGNDQFDSAHFGRALEALDSTNALADVIEQATNITEENFSVTVRENGSTVSRRRMLLYAPLYLSSHCINHCLYCGFRYPNQIERKHLSVEQALREAEVLIARRFRHILLVAGDFPSLTTPEYYVQIIRALAERGVACGIEIAPQATEVYRRLADAGACGITLYQETYDERLYRKYHPRGSKRSYHWRLEAMDRAAEGGLRRLGLGVLLGLANPREDLVAMLRHARYLANRFPHCTLAFSLPRIHEAPEGFVVPHPVDDETFVRSYCALRIAFPRAELVLSTREPVELRNRLVAICITQMSAGSSTVPGGYEDAEVKSHLGKQFPISDHRTPAQVAQWLGDRGFHVSWRIGRSG